MSNVPRNNRFAFRPTLNEGVLEERVVLNGARMIHALATTQVQTGATTGVGNVTVRQLYSSYLQQLRSATENLKLYVNNQVALLYQNGQPTAQQRTDFNANVQGAINATALQLSSQYSLLPNASRRLLPTIQNALLGSGRNSLSSQIQNIAQSDRLSRSGLTLQNAMDRRINVTASLSRAQLSNFFNTTNFRRLSVDQTGQQIPLGQFLGSQLVSQVNNTFGSLAGSFPNAASGLFANGTTPTTDSVTAFNQQASGALGTAAFQLGSALSVIPNAMTALGPQLQSALFATGTNATTGLANNSLLSGLQGLPFTTAASSNEFNTAAQTTFGSNFGNVVSPLFSFFGLQTPAAGANGQPNFTLPSGPFNSVLGQQFTGNTFNSGFNNGFGTGFVGFGQSPTGFNSNFGTGFNNFIGTGNTQLGFNNPTFGTGSTFGFGQGVNGGPLGTGTTSGGTVTTGGSTFTGGTGGGFFV